MPQPETAQQRALQNYRKRLSERGVARFEVLGLDKDRELIRALARALADDTSQSAQLRVTVEASISGTPPKRGGVLSALRNSPLVGSGIDLTRPAVKARRLDL